MTIKEYVINAVAAAAVIGAGSTLIGTKINDARQDDHIAQLQSLSIDVNGLRVDLQRVDKKLERLDGKMEGEEKRSGARK
jgi:hypothetical protein